MRFFHSFWSKPMSDNHIAPSLVNYATSFAYAKQLGAEVVLHTDTRGAELLSAIPYDEVIIDLNDIEERITRFWAYGKLVATKNEPIESIHIDGDVFLTLQALVPALEQNCDLLVQSEEDASWRFDQSYQLSQYAISQYNLPEGLHIYHPNAYNCGLVRFNNPILKERYLNAYFDIVDYSLEDPMFIKRCDEHKGSQKGTVIPDLIAEQQVPHELAQGYDVKLLLPPPVNTHARKMGYIHLLGKAKYIWWQDVAAKLQEVSQVLYEDIMTSDTFRLYKQLL